MISQIRQNTCQTSFKRGFKPRELRALASDNTKVAINVGFDIGAGKIRPEDGAIKQLDAYINNFSKVSAFFYEAKSQLQKIAAGTPKEPERAIPGILPREVRALRFPDENKELVLATAVKAGQGVINAPQAAEFLNFFTKNYVATPALEHFKGKLASH